MDSIKDHSTHSTHLNRSHPAEIGCPQPSLKSSATLASSEMTQSRRLSEKVDPHNKTVKGLHPIKAANYSQADEEAYRSEGTKKYNTERWNLEALLKAKNSDCHFQSKEHIERDNDLSESFMFDKNCLESVVRPCSFPRKHSRKRETAKDFMPKTSEDATLPILGHGDNNTLSLYRKLLAENALLSDPSTGVFPFQKEIGTNYNNISSCLMNLLAADSQEKLKHAGLDKTNTASRLLFPINQCFDFSNFHIGAPDRYNEKLIRDIVRYYYPNYQGHNFHVNGPRLNMSPILGQILQKNDPTNQDVDKLSKILSAYGYSASNVHSLISSRVQQGNGAYSLSPGETGFKLHQPNYSVINPLDTNNSHTNDNSYIDLATYLLSNHLCSNLSNTCHMCHKSIDPNEINHKKNTICQSCSYQQNKKFKSDHSDTASTIVRDPMTKKVGDWDIIPVNSLLLIGTDEDTIWLSELLCFLRRQIEYFTATQSDAFARMRRGGAKQSVFLGRVGIRCIHCRHISPDSKTKGAVSYPQSIRILHQSVRNWQRYHLLECGFIPSDTKNTYQSLKNTRSHSGSASLSYWIRSSLQLGMVDTGPEGGIRYHDPRKPRKHQLYLHPVCAALETNSKHEYDDKLQHDLTSINETSDFGDKEVIPYRELSPSLLEPGDEKEVSPFTFLLLSQQQPVHYTRVDLISKRKRREINYPGVQCRHCISHGAGSGRYFPPTVKAFTKDNEPGNCFHTHIMKCARCPQIVKDELKILEDGYAQHAYKLESGLKKKFFDRLWFRLHGSQSPLIADQSSKHKAVSKTYAS